MRSVLILFIFVFAGNAFAMTPPELLAQNGNDYARHLVSLFAHYPASIIHTFVKPQPKIEKNTEAYNYRSEITRQFADEGVNFGGKWGLIAVACGSTCSKFFLVDGVTGAVTDTHLTATNGTPVFAKNSGLLLVTPPRFSSKESASPKGWIVHNGQLQLVEIE